MYFNVLNSHKRFSLFYSRHDPQQLCFNFGQCDSASADSTRHLQEQHLEGKDLRGKQNCSDCLNVTSITKRQIAKVCNFLKNSNSTRFVRALRALTRDPERFYNKMLKNVRQQMSGRQMSPSALECRHSCGLKANPENCSPGL